VSPQSAGAGWTRFRNHPAIVCPSTSPLATFRICSTASSTVRKLALWRVKSRIQKTDARRRAQFRTGYSGSGLCNDKCFCQRQVPHLANRSRISMSRSVKRTSCFMNAFLSTCPKSWSGRPTRRGHASLASVERCQHVIVERQADLMDLASTMFAPGAKVVPVRNRFAFAERRF
jgi:hypothetical protein